MVGFDLISCHLCKFCVRKLRYNYCIIYSQNPDGTTSAVIKVNTNYLNFLNNATQSALNSIGAIITIITNTSKFLLFFFTYFERVE